MLLSRTFIAIVVNCIIATALFAQDLGKDFEAIAKKMETSNSVNLEVDVKVYSQKGASLIYSSKATALKMGKNSTKSILAEMEYIQTSEYELKLDHEEKAILIFKKTKEVNSKGESFEFDIEKLKNLLVSDDKVDLKVTLLSNTNGIKKYSVKGLTGIKEVQIDLSIDQLKLIAVRYEYGSTNDLGQYIILKYSKFDYNTDLSSHFDLTNYFTVVEGEYHLNSRLKDYQLYTEH